MPISTFIDSAKDPVEINISIDQESLCFTNCRELGNILRKVITPEVGKCTLDLHHIEYIDSMGLGTFLIARERLGNRNDVQLVNVQTKVKEVLSTANFPTIFSIE